MSRPIGTGAGEPRNAHSSRTGLRNPVVFRFMNPIRPAVRAALVLAGDDARFVNAAAPVVADMRTAAR